VWGCHLTEILLTGAATYLIGVRKMPNSHENQ